MYCGNTIEDMVMKKALILINESAGTRKAGNYVMQIVSKAAAAGYEPIVYPIVPGTKFTSEELVAKYGAEVDLVLCSGGDGTMNHVMNALMKFTKKPQLAYVPAGSANDFAKGLGVPANRSRAIETAFSGNTFSYDVGKMNENYFNYVAAFGAFTEASYDTKQEWKNVLGYAAYFLTAVGELYQNIHYSHHIRITTEEGTEEGDYIFGAVSNSVSVGGLPLFGKTGIRLDDGRMELLLIRVPKNLIELQTVIATLGKGQSNHPNILFKQVTGATFESKKKVAWTLDGEYGGSYAHTKIEVMEHAISVMTSRRGKDASF